MKDKTLQGEIENPAGSTIILINPVEIRKGGSIKFHERQFGRIVRKGVIKIDDVDWEKPRAKRSK